MEARSWKTRDRGTGLPAAPKAASNIRKDQYAESRKRRAAKKMPDPGSPDEATAYIIIPILNRTIIHIFVINFDRIITTIIRKYYDKYIISSIN
jgi:hypothetical protein